VSGDGDATLDLPGHDPHGPGHKAIDPRLAEEVQATNAAFDTTTKALERESVQRNSTAPIQIARFDA
jgi:hypothetical protein